MISGEAVFARCLSSLKDERVEASRVLIGPQSTRYDGNRKQMIEDIKRVNVIFNALLFSQVAQQLSFSEVVDFIR